MVEAEGMIFLTLSAVVRDITIEVQGDAEDLDQIQETWESFVLATHQVEQEYAPPDRAASPEGASPG